MEPEDVERWLAREARGDEHGAESAFAHLLAAVPRIEPRSGFGERAEAAVWRRRPQRVRTRAIWAAVLLLATFGGVAAFWLALPSVGPWLLTSGAVMALGSLVGVVKGAIAALAWWAAGARVAGAIGETLAYRETAGALIAVGIVGAVALYSLHQLTRNPRTHGRW